MDVREIACLSSLGTTGRRLGTAFLVGPELALTARHVLRGVEAGAPICFKFGDVLVETDLELVVDDDEQDWAILRCPAPANLPRLSLSETLASTESWRTRAYPRDDVRQKALPLHGTITAVDVGEGGAAQHVALFVEQAASGLDARGASGAPVLVDGSVVAIITGGPTDAATADVRAGTLYATPIAAVMMNDGARELLRTSAMRGVPAVRTDQLPPSPYLGLRPYGAEHAELFFGRGEEIRTLIEMIAGEAPSRVVLLYGQSGVGKSSLLSAGVVPRLRELHQVRHARRDPGRGLLETLATCLGTSSDPHAMSEAWHTIERDGAPLTVVLDQVEDAYATNEDEAHVFFEALRTMLESSPAPRGRLVLGFRKEWLAEVQREVGHPSEGPIPHARYLLARMSHRGIVEAVRGPTLTARLRARYKLVFVPDCERPDLAERIATELSTSAQTPLAPMLQALLYRMWRDESAASNAGKVCFSHKSYEAYSRALPGFLAEQLARVATKHPVHVASGLALDLLFEHTSGAKGKPGVATALSTTSVERSKAYPHVPNLEALIDALSEARLLSDPAEQAEHRRTYLAHDTLAPVVEGRYHASTLPGQRARRVLEGRVTGLEQPEKAPALDEADLTVVLDGRQGMRGLRPAESSLIQRSESAVRNARRIRKVVVGVLTALAILLVVAAAMLRTQVLDLQAATRASAFQQTQVAAEQLHDPLTALNALTVSLSPTDADLNGAANTYLARLYSLALRAPIVRVETQSLRRLNWPWPESVAFDPHTGVVLPIPASDDIDDPLPRLTSDGRFLAALTTDGATTLRVSDHTVVQLFAFDEVAAQLGSAYEWALEGAANPEANVLGRPAERPWVVASRDGHAIAVNNGGEVIFLSDAHPARVVETWLQSVAFDMPAPSARTFVLLVESNSGSRHLPWVDDEDTTDGGPLERTQPPQRLRLYALGEPEPIRTIEADGVIHGFRVSPHGSAVAVTVRRTPSAAETRCHYRRSQQTWSHYDADCGGSDPRRARTAQCGDLFEVRTYSLPEGRPLQDSAHIQSCAGLEVVDVTDDGQVALVAGAGSTRVWNSMRGDFTELAPGHNRWVAFGASEEFVVAADSEWTLSIYDSKSGELLCGRLRPPTPVEVAFLNDRRDQYWTIETNGVLSVWPIRTTAPAEVLTGNPTVDKVDSLTNDVAPMNGEPAFVRLLPRPFETRSVIASWRPSDQAQPSWFAVASRRQSEMALESESMFPPNSPAWITVYERTSGLPLTDIFTFADAHIHVEGARADEEGRDLIVRWAPRVPGSGFGIVGRPRVGPSSTRLFVATEPRDTIPSWASSVATALADASEIDDSQLVAEPLTLEGVVGRLARLPRLAASCRELLAAAAEGDEGARWILEHAPAYQTARAHHVCEPGLPEP